MGSRAWSRVSFAARTYPVPPQATQKLAPNAGTQGPSPVFAPGAGAGTGASAAGSSGNDTAGTVFIMTGTAASTGTIAIVTFAKPFANPPSVVITPQTAQTAALVVSVQATTVGFVIFTAGAIPSTTPLLWSYIALGT